jgi:hypothetical protein
MISGVFEMISGVFEMIGRRFLIVPVPILEILRGISLNMDRWMTCGKAYHKPAEFGL